LRMREENRPAVADPVVKLDLALRRLSCEIWSGIVDAHINLQALCEIVDGPSSVTSFRRDAKHVTRSRYQARRTWSDARSNLPKYRSAPDRSAGRLRDCGRKR